MENKISFEPNMSLSVKIACPPTSREELERKLANCIESFFEREKPFACTVTDVDGNILFSSQK